MIKRAGECLRRVWPRVVLGGAVAAWPLVASAHVGGGAFILLLPTQLYVGGGAIVVAASFALIALAPPRLFSRLPARCDLDRR
jgi:hypothetical protein